MKNFKANHTGKSTYTCRVCGLVTRETGLGEQSIQLCAYCFEESSMENSVSDGAMEIEEFNTRLAEFKKTYNRNEDGTPKSKSEKKGAKKSAPAIVEPTPEPIVEVEPIAEPIVEPTPAPKTKRAAKKSAPVIESNDTLEAVDDESNAAAKETKNAAKARRARARRLAEAYLLACVELHFTIESNEDASEISLEAASLSNELAKLPGYAKTSPEQ